MMLSDLWSLFMRVQANYATEVMRLQVNDSTGVIGLQANDAVGAYDTDGRLMKLQTYDAAGVYVSQLCCRCLCGFNPMIMPEL
jgi:hypothetical protein